MTAASEMNDTSATTTIDGPPMVSAWRRRTFVRSSTTTRGRRGEVGVQLAVADVEGDHLAGALAAAGSR